MRKVLYISNEDRQLGGSSMSLQNMLESLYGSIDPIILFREEGRVCEHFRSLGYDCRVIPFRRVTFHYKGLVRVIRYIPHLITNTVIQRKCINKARQLFKDVNLVHGNSSSVDIGYAIAKKLGVPHVWHIREYLDIGMHEDPFPCWSHWKHVLRESDAVIAISKGLFDHLGLSCHKNAFCIPDAVRFSSDTVLEKNKEKYIAFLSGTISELKRPDDAIRIFAGAGLEGYELRIIGSISEEMRSSLQTLADSLGVKKQVLFLPFTNDVKACVSKAAAVLVCTEFEGMGRVSIEAMFYGCPVIARDSGGSADVLEHGKLGHLYKNVEEASAMLGEVIANYPLEQVQKAQSTAIKEYSTENYKSRLLEVYDSLK